MQRRILLAMSLGVGLIGGTASAAGDPEEGARAFRSCAACHALRPGEHRTGPSLAGIVGRTAGTVEGFRRYSPALQKAEVVWTEDMLDAWLADPQAVIPGNRMTFPGIADAQARADLIAYLETATEPVAVDAGPGGTMGGMMGAREPADLRQEIGPNNRITAIRYCEDTYTVEVETGDAHPFWEFNLRFKTDSSGRGPEPGRPVLIPSGMMGDRAFVVFAAPGEITPFIQAGC